MSEPGGEGVPAGAALSPRARAIIAMGLAGLLLGFLWGVADVPRYTAVATVLVTGERGAPAGEVELEAAADLARSARVAQGAAGLLGGDVGGADLLSEIAVSADPGAGAVRVEAEADSPDFAAAAANGYALALVDAGGKRFEEGAEASIPGAPSESRSALRWSLLGLVIGLLAGAALVASRSRAGAAPRRAPEPASSGDAFGAPVLASFATPTDLLGLEDGAVDLDPGAERALRGLAEGIGLGGDGPRRIAVLDTAAGDGSVEVLAGLAIAAGGLGLRAVAVEGDLDEPALAERVGAAAAPGLSDYLRGTAGPRDVLRSVPVRPAEERAPLVFVPAGEPGAGPTEGVGGERFAGLMERLPRIYDLVLLSAPPLGRGGDAATIARLADGVVLVAADDDGARSRIAGAAERLGAARLLGGVLTAPAPAQSRRQRAVRRPSRAGR